MVYREQDYIKGLEPLQSACVDSVSVIRVLGESDLVSSFCLDDDDDE